MFGSSRTLAVGPVAMVSLMTASALSELGDTDNQMAGALILALASGLMLLVMGVARLGFLANFLSHPVISGFTTEEKLVMGFPSSSICSAWRFRAAKPLRRVLRDHQSASHQR